MLYEQLQVTSVPPGLQQLQRAQVDLLVAGARVRDRRLVLGERRRIEHDRVEPLAEPLEAAQLVEHVADAGVDGDAVARGVLPDARDRVLGDVERDRLVAAPPQHQREAAVVAEAVEQPAARVGRRRGAVLALIEKQPGLLAVPQIDVVLRCRSR